MTEVTFVELGEVPSSILCPVARLQMFPLALKWFKYSALKHPNFLNKAVYHLVHYQDMEIISPLIFQFVY